MAGNIPPISATDVPIDMAQFALPSKVACAVPVASPVNVTFKSLAVVNFAALDAVLAFPESEPLNVGAYTVLLKYPFLHLAEDVPISLELCAYGNNPVLINPLAVVSALFAPA